MTKDRMYTLKAAQLEDDDFVGLQDFGVQIESRDGFELSEHNQQEVVNQIGKATSVTKNALDYQRIAQSRKKKIKIIYCCLLITGIIIIPVLLVTVSSYLGF